MNCIALHETQLSRFSHHWLWGLRVDQHAKPNLYDAVLRLEQRPKEREKIEDDVERVQQKSGFIRLFFWLFNIRQYRFHYYQINAYRSWQLYNQGKSMLSEISQPHVTVNYTNALLIGAFMVVSSATIIANLLSPQKRKMLAEFTLSLLRVSPGLKKVVLVTPRVTETLDMPASLNRSTESSMDTLDTEPYFVVTTSMLDPLAALSLAEPSPGAHISFKTLKEAFNQARLNTHPDKTSGRSEAFIKVTEAYQSLLSEIKKQETYPQSPSNNLYRTQFVDEEMGRLDRALSSLRDERIEISRAVQAYAQRVDKYAEKANAFGEGVVRLGENIQRLDKKIQRVNEGMKRQDEGIQRVDEGMRRQDAKLLANQKGIDEIREVRDRILAMRAARAAIEGGSSPESSPSTPVRASTSPHSFHAESAANNEEDKTNSLTTAL